MSNRDNTGVLFRNQYAKDEKHPVYKGRGEYQGAQFEIAAWVRTDQNGDQYLSLAFQPPYEKRSDQPQREKTPGYVARDDKDLPF